MQIKQAIRLCLIGSSVGVLLSSCGLNTSASPSPEPQAELIEPVEEQASNEEEIEEEFAEASMDARPAYPLSRDGVNYVSSSTPELPRLRFKDGQMSLSDSCAIRMGNKLSRKVPPAYVNGQPLGFC